MANPQDMLRSHIETMDPSLQNFRLLSDQLQKQGADLIWHMPEDPEELRKYRNKYGTFDAEKQENHSFIISGSMFSLQRTFHLTKIESDYLAIYVALNISQLNRDMAIRLNILTPRKTFIGPLLNRKDNIYFFEKIISAKDNFTVQLVNSLYTQAKNSFVLNSFAVAVKTSDEGMNSTNLTSSHTFSESKIFGTLLEEKSEDISLLKEIDSLLAEDKKQESLQKEDSGGEERKDISHLSDKKSQSTIKTREEDKRKTSSSKNIAKWTVPPIALLVATYVVYKYDLGGIKTYFSGKK